MEGLTARYLVDKSALARLDVPAVAARLRPLIEGKEVALPSMVVMEMLFSAQNLRSFRALRNELAAVDLVPAEQWDFDRGIDVMESLASRGQHRSVPLPDLLIAAAAERAGLWLMHYDEDFERVAKITKQAVEWVVPQGSL